MKLAAGAFLAGAGSRLLPASIPFRFFGAAVVCHVLAWLGLLVDAQSVPRFAGGLTPTLAALHLLTLGVLAMSAIGASLQLLPVATRQPIGASWIGAALFWLYTPGVLVLAAGMTLGHSASVAVGAVAVVAALVVYAALLWRNLVAASAMPIVTAYGRIAVVSLVIALLTALSLVGSYVGVGSMPRTDALGLHIAFASYGFMGMLVLGFSYVLVPMFALSAAPDARRGRLSWQLALAALTLNGLAVAGIVPTPLRVAALAAAAASVVIHVALMRTALASGMRRELGRSAQLMKMAWAMLAASLVAALGLALDLPFDGLATLFGVLLLPGWLLTFLLAILQRIVPFLASMHAARRQRRPPTPSALTADRPLAVHFSCHAAALAILVLAIVLDSVALARVAAVIGLAGALAFAVFFAIVGRRLAAVRTTGQSSPSG